MCTGMFMIWVRVLVNYKAGFHIHITSHQHVLIPICMYYLPLDVIYKSILSELCGLILNSRGIIVYV